MKEIVIIAGGNGMVGSYLNRWLTAAGYEVRILTRNKSIVDNQYRYYWNSDKEEIDFSVFEQADYLIQLSGENLADKRWTAARKAALRNSRIQTTHFLYQTIADHNVKLKAYIGTSAVGYYGAEPNGHVSIESDAPGHDFLASLCVEWEKEHLQFQKLGIRTVIMRFGVVLAKGEGALAPLSHTVRWGVGAVLGNGKQIIPWIHITDLCRMLHFVLSNAKTEGIYNAVAPNPVNNREMMHALAKQLKRFIILPPAPAFVLQLILGEMSSMVLTGNQVDASKIQAAGYTFKYPALKPALKNIFE